MSSGTPRDWRDGYGLLLAEFSAFALIFWADQPGFHLIVFSKTLYLAVLAAVSLTLRRAWPGVGLLPDKRVFLLILVGVLGGMAMEVLELFVTQPLLTNVFGGGPDLSDFAAIKGNVSLLAPFLLMTWTVAAVGEEFVYRGYLLNRFAGFIPGERVATSAAVALSSVIFGLAHLYQGPVGVIENVVDGLALATLYVASGRQLLVPFLAHGLQDTTDFLLIFSGHYPGQ